MEVFIKIMVWLFLSGVGMALAAFVGGEGKVLNKKHEDSALLPAVKLMLGLLIIWGITVSALVLYQSLWYLVSIIVAAGFLWICASGNPVEKDESGLSPELQKFDDELQALAKAYDELIEQKRGSALDFMTEDLLPASKNEVAEALQLVYYFRLMRLGSVSYEDELFKRYEELAHFLKDDDARFMNDFAELFNSKVPGNFNVAVELLESDPDKFEADRVRMMNIYHAVGVEKELLWDAWENARESSV